MVLRLCGRAPDIGPKDTHHKGHPPYLIVVQRCGIWSCRAGVKRTWGHRGRLLGTPPLPPIRARNVVINLACLRTPNSTLAHIEMNSRSCAVYCCGRRVRIGPIEFRLLRHLLQHPGRIFSRKEMIHAAWPNHVFVEPRSVEAHIVRLRKALNERREAGLIRSASSRAYSRRSTGPGYELTQRRVLEPSASWEDRREQHPPDR